jgi:hypothetical protein
MMDPDAGIYENRFHFGSSATLELGNVESE